MWKGLVLAALLINATLALKPSHDDYPSAHGERSERPASSARKGTTAVGVKNARSKLRDDLLKEYDRTTRPVRDIRHGTTVSVGLWVNNFDLTWDGKLETNIFMLMSWEDQFLKWNPAEYDGVKTLFVPTDDIWIPDVFFYNNFEEPQGQKGDDRLNALVFNNGSALVVPPLTLQTICQTDFTHWPYDTQNCSIVVGPWVYDTKEMAVVSAMDFIVNEDAGLNRWRLVEKYARDESRSYPCCPGQLYDRVTFTIRFQRTSYLDQGLAVVPLIVVYLLAVSSFLLPVGSNQRYVFNGVAILASLMTVISIRFNVGSSSDGYPRVALLHLINILAIAVLQAISVVVLSVSRSNSGAKLSALLSKLMSKNSQDEDIDKLIVKEKLKEIDDTKRNVSTAVTVADRFFLVAYLVATVTLATIFRPNY